MNALRLALPLVALAGAAQLAFIGSGEAYTFLGGSLDLTQRDFRVHDNFTDPEANDNQTPDPNFPGATGATLAIWKGVAEWGSALHGAGGGDPTQADGIGSGGANFDSSYQGAAPDPGGTNDNVFSQISGFGGGLLAFTELRISDGWRIRFYEDPSIWHDGPGIIPNGPTDKDIQGVAAHEYGHALGLDHTLDPGATMQGSGSGNQIENRSIEADDIAGIQALYGVASAGKPRVTGYTLAGGQVVVSGANFAASGNEVWFTRGSGVGDGTPVKAVNLMSTAGGTELVATIPAEAGAGDLLVKVPGVSHDALSNAWPFDPVLGFCPPAEVLGTGKPRPNGSVPTLTPDGTPSVFYGGFSLSLVNARPNAPAILFHGQTAAAIPFMGGTLYSSGPYVRDTFFNVDFLGFASFPMTVDPTLVGTRRVYQVWFQDPGASFGVGLSNGVAVEYCL